MNDTLTNSWTRLAPVLLLAARLVAAAPPAGASDAARENLTRGKLEADLGHLPLAVEAFEAVANDPGAPPSLRAEALVRLGTARRLTSDEEGAVKAFQRAVPFAADDPASRRLLALAVDGVAPGEERWSEIWRSVSMKVERDAKGRLSAGITWPGAPARSRTASSGEPITLQLEGADLANVLGTFSALTGTKITLPNELHGTVTADLQEVPWDEALARILDSQGLAMESEADGAIVVRSLSEGARPASAEPRKRAEKTGGR